MASGANDRRFDPTLCSHFSLFSCSISRENSGIVINCRNKACIYPALKREIFSRHGPLSSGVIMCMYGNFTVRLVTVRYFMPQFFIHGILVDFPAVTEHKQLTCKVNKVPGKINCQETMQKKKQFVIFHGLKNTAFLNLKQLPNYSSNLVFSIFFVLRENISLFLYKTRF